MSGRTNLQSEHHFNDNPEVPPGSVQTRGLVDGAVTAPKIADDALTAPKIQGVENIGDSGGECIPACAILVIDEGSDGDATVTVPFTSGRRIVIKGVRMSVDVPGGAGSTARLSASAMNVTEAMGTDVAANEVVDAASIVTGPHATNAVVLTRTDTDTHLVLFIDYVYV